MPVSELKLVKRCVEFCEIDEIREISSNTRGIYVLFKRRRKFNQRSEKWRDKYDVVYIGMARGTKSGAHSQLDAHRKPKGGTWTHFSIFEVWTESPRLRLPISSSEHVWEAIAASYADEPAVAGYKIGAKPNRKLHNFAS